MGKDKVGPAKQTEEDKRREKILADINDAQVSLLRLQAAKLGIEQGMIHLQIELQSM